MQLSLPRRAFSNRKLVAIIAVVLLAVAGLSVLTAPKAVAAPPTTMWGSDEPGRVELDSDRRAVELGTEFTPRVDGEVTGIRFYKLDGMSGQHTGTLWTASGRELSSVTFTDETDSGWQTAVLPAPVEVEAGDSYVVSYSVPSGGRYATTVAYFGRSESSALNVNWRNSGVYTYDDGAFPAETWWSSQYWADVTFLPSPQEPGSGESPSPTAEPTVEPTTEPSPTATPSATPTPTATPSPSPTETATPTPTPTPSATPTTPPPAAGGYPTRESAGLPDGWVPTTRVTGDYWVRQAGQVVEDLQITNGTIIIDAPNVTLRRIQGIGSNIVNGYGSSCEENLLVEDSEFTANGRTADADMPVIQFGGYTVRNIMIDGVPEGLRVGGSDMDCGPVAVYDSFIRVKSPTDCVDWHGDGIQGYDGGHVTVRQSTILMEVVGDCYGTAPFFYPSGQGNTSVDIDGLLVGGGGYPFRSGMPGPVLNVKVIDGSWVYGPVDVRCSVVSAWSAQVVRLDSAGQPSTVRSIGCTGQGN